MTMMKIFATDKIINDDVNYVGIKPVLKKNYYGIGVDAKTGKSFLTNIKNVTKLQAKNIAMRWAKANKLVFEGVYSN